MGFSFSMEGRNIALDSPERIDTLIEFLRLYKTLTGSVTPTGSGGDSNAVATGAASVPPSPPADADDNPNPSSGDAPPPLDETPPATGRRRPVIPPPGQQMADYIVRVLEGVGGTSMDSNDIVNAMLAVGWTTRVDGEYKRRHMIDSLLRRKKDQFARLPDGKWVLANQTAAPKAP
ncbi:MAG: hypothetical protein H8F28_20480 [Fibrella sp.]|nr:hypothetical protein [Armatimonadota bacterium]